MGLQIKEYKIIWPANINNQKTLSFGRKLSKKKCVSNPTIDEIYNASKKLNLNPQKEEFKCYPKDMYGYKGYIKVYSNDNKRYMLIELAKIIKKERNNEIIHK